MIGLVNKILKPENVKYPNPRISLIPVDNLQFLSRANY
jgi:hypothetical protein